MQNNVAKKYTDFKAQARSQKKDMTIFLCLKNLIKMYTSTPCPKAKCATLIDWYDNNSDIWAIEMVSMYSTHRHI